MTVVKDHPLEQPLPHLRCRSCNQPLTLAMYETGSQRQSVNLYYKCTTYNCPEKDESSPRALSPPRVKGDKTFRTEP